MKICIRVDGGCAIGMGHVMRCIALAKELSKENTVYFACRVDVPLTNKYYPGIKLIKESGFLVMELKENNLIEEINLLEADCIITDSYEVNEEYFDILKQWFDVSGCLDDEKICNYFNVDFLINQNIYAGELDYKVNNSTKLLLGSKFVILRDEFRNFNKKKNINKTIKDVMITVGGSDKYNLTERIVKDLKDDNYILHVVIGKGFTYLYDLKKYETEGVKLYFDANMKELMEMVDVCIASCGTTIYELASCATPTIGIIVAENQELLAKTMKEKKCIEFSEIPNIKDTLNNLNYEKRKSLSIKCGELVDGLGIERLSNDINKIIRRE